MARRIIVFTCLALLIVFSTGTRAGSHNGRDIIIDTDMGLDDVRAIFALLADSNCTVHGIITVEGSASLGKGTDNLIGLLEKIEMDDLPVYRGARRSGVTPPSWRKTADALAGNPFPPPRHITALDAHEGFHDLIAGSKTPPIYLTLGPLGNLAAMESEELGSIESIWIPAVIDKGELKGWNLSFDPESAFDVLNKAVKIVIVDVGAASQLNARAILDSVEGSSVAASWINVLLSVAEGHLMIYDEIAAVAVIRTELVTTDSTHYGIVRGSDENFHIERAKGGTIRIAHITDMDTAAHELLTLWERKIEGDDHHHDTTHEGEHIDPELYIKTFHGHLGPYLALGYRIGRIALRELDSEGHFGLRVHVHSKLKPPASCLIDGVQLGSGCTLGKRNIDISETVGPAFAEFENERGERIRISLKNDIPRLIAEMIRESGVVEAGERFLHMSEESVFDLRRQ